MIDLRAFRSEHPNRQATFILFMTYMAGVDPGIAVRGWKFLDFTDFISLEICLLFSIVFYDLS